MLARRLRAAGRTVLRGIVLVAACGLAACATPSSSPQAVQRLDPAELARLEAARPEAPLSLEEVVRQSRAGVPTATLLETLSATGTRHALSPSEAVRLREQGVAPEVLDALAAAQERWARDQATADKVRRDTEQAAALDKAKAEAERYRRQSQPQPYWDPFWPYPYAYPPGYPGWRGYGGIGWGGRIRR